MKGRDCRGQEERHLKRKKKFRKARGPGEAKKRSATKAQKKTVSSKSRGPVFIASELSG